MKLSTFILLPAAFVWNIRAQGSNIKNSIISRIYIQSTLAHLAEEVKLEIPLTLVTNTNLQELPTGVHDVLTVNHGENIMIGTLLCVVFAKYVVFHMTNTPTEWPTLHNFNKWKKLHPLIEIDQIYNQTKTALLLMMVLLFKNVSDVF